MHREPCIFVHCSELQRSSCNDNNTVHTVRCGRAPITMYKCSATKLHACNAADLRGTMHGVVKWCDGLAREHYLLLGVGVCLSRPGAGGRACAPCLHCSGGPPALLLCGRESGQCLPDIIRQEQGVCSSPESFSFCSSAGTLQIISSRNYRCSGSGGSFSIGYCRFSISMDFLPGGAPQEDRGSSGRGVRAGPCLSI
jgi:hypothetical protein